MTQPLRLVQTSAPAIEPLSASDAKIFLRVDHSTDDSLIAALVASARQCCENYTGRALIQQGWSLYLDAWPGSRCNLWWDGLREGVVHSGPQPFVSVPRAPLISVTEIVVYDDEDQGQIWANANYFVDTASTPGRIVLRSGAVPPAPTRSANGIEIKFTAGYGLAASSVPQSLIEGIRRMVAYMYEHRGDTVETALRASGAENLWQPWRLMGVA